jgi:enamine deaminase RidA (YjgF/YER057c/UK114 family)
MSKLEYLRPEGFLHKPAFSQVVTALGARTIYTAGQVSIDKRGALVGAGDLAAQTTQALRSTRLALAAAGASYSKSQAAGIIRDNRVLSVNWLASDQEAISQLFAGVGSVPRGGAASPRDRLAVSKRRLDLLRLYNSQDTRCRRAHGRLCGGGRQNIFGQTRAADLPPQRIRNDQNARRLGRATSARRGVAWTPCVQLASAGSVQIKTGKSLTLRVLRRAQLVA